MEHFDVLIVGAGLSGIGAAYHLQRDCPAKTYAILEARGAIGGTWDLFRYPGIRSDSDMFTLGYSFKPWLEAKAIADGPSILNYVRETARENAIEPHIRFNHKAIRAEWNSADARWIMTFERPGADGQTQSVQYSCSFISMCSGYYDYAGGYMPEFPGIAAYQGKVIHPQNWPEDFDYTGKKVVVIGSGATAVTLVPEMAKTAAHVSMLQRSPTYVVSRPARDAFADWLRNTLPSRLAYALVRWRNVFFGMFFYNRARTKPRAVKKWLINMVREHLGPDYDVKKHFTPSYNPWDQRLCLVPDADMFDAIKSGRASVVTDTISTFTPEGIRLNSGEVLAADVVVSATGLKLLFMAGLQVFVDGAKVDFPKTWGYKGMMYSGVPNLASTFGYTNASWTLKADLTAEYVCRLINHMDAHGYRQCMPVQNDPNCGEEPWLSFSSGYITRALAEMPKQGTGHPWKLYQNYLFDLFALRFGSVKDANMKFTKPVAKATSAP